MSQDAERNDKNSNKINRERWSPVESREIPETFINQSVQPTIDNGGCTLKGSGIGCHSSWVPNQNEWNLFSQSFIQEIDYGEKPLWRNTHTKPVCDSQKSSRKRWPPSATSIKSTIQTWCVVQSVSFVRKTLTIQKTMGGWCSSDKSDKSLSWSVFS